MSALSVYSYYDAAGYRKYADSDDVAFTGTWCSTGSYYASALQVINYGQSQYLCITDSVGQNPSIQPTKWKPTRYWSSFVLVMAGTGTVADPAYQIAVEALELAETNATTLSTGWAGTVSVWASGSLGGPANSQLVFVNGILTTYAP